MSTWLASTLKILTSEVFMEPLIAIIVGYGVKQLNKSRRNQILGELVIDIVDYVEEHYEEWGIRGTKKMERFLQIFREEFKRQLGKEPSSAEIQSARMKAEGYVQRARRMQVKG